MPRSKPWARRTIAFAISLLAPVAAFDRHAYAFCGDGTLEPYESCDDGNLVGGDGCGAECRAESPRFDWFQTVFTLRSGLGFGTRFGQQAVVHDGRLLVLRAGYDSGAAELFESESGKFITGVSNTEPDDGFFGPLSTIDDDFLIADGSIAWEFSPIGKVTRHDADALALRQTFLDPTPETPGFGTAILGHRGRVFVQDVGDDVVHVFEGERGRFLRALHGSKGDTSFGRPLVGFGDSVLIGGSSAVNRYAVVTGRLVARLRDPTPRTHGFGTTVVPFEGNVLVGGINESAAYLFSSSGRLLHTFRDPDGMNPTFGTGLTARGSDVVISTAVGLSQGRVYVFDGATRRLRYTLRDPDPERGECFGEATFAFGGLLAVSDPCWDREPPDFDLGIIYLFDGATGERVGEIHNPNGDTWDAFKTLATYGTTILGHGRRAGEQGFVVASRSCADGNVESGEECDDDNVANGDGCDVSCTVSRCANRIRAGEEECDDGNTHDGDGCSAACRRESIVECPAVPRQGCLTTALADRSRLYVRTSPGNPQLHWEWLDTHSTRLVDFGDPRIAESYSFCVYDDEVLTVSEHVRNGLTCTGPDSCWRLTDDGYRYRNPDGTRSLGLKQIGLFAQEPPMRTRIVVKSAREEYASLIDAQFSRLQIQLTSSTGRCWQTLFQPLHVVRRDRNELYLRAR